MTIDRIAVSADQALVRSSRGRLEELRDVTVVIEQGRIQSIGHGPVSDAIQVPLPARSLLAAGFVDAHLHSLNGPLFRGRTEDRPRAGISSLVYDFLMPVGDLAAKLLTFEQSVEVCALGLSSALMSGTTTAFDVFRPDTTALIAAARKLGIRLYAAPYVASSSIMGLDAAGRPREVPRDEDEEVSAANQIFANHDEGSEGLIRIAYGPHCSDTCSPGLLVRLMKESQLRKTLLTIHVSQSRLEVETIQSRYGVTPIRHLINLGVCGPGVVLAHAVFATDEDLRLLAETGSAVASCPATFAQGGIHVDYQRFERAGVTVGIGTDGYSTSMREELRAAGVLTKLQTGRSDTANAGELLTAATIGSARVLGRDDIGALRVGSRGDLVGFVFDRAADPRTRDARASLIWDPNAAHVTFVCIDGKIVVRDGNHLTTDLASLADRVGDSIDGVWEEARGRLGISPRSEAPPSTSSEMLLD